MCLPCPGGYEEHLSTRRIVLSASSPARPRPAAPLCAPTRPARGISAFGTQLWVYKNVYWFAICGLFILVTGQSHVGPRSYFSWTGYDAYNPGRLEYIPPFCKHVEHRPPDLPQAGRVGAHGGASGRRRARLDADRAIRPGDKRLN